MPNENEEVKADEAVNTEEANPETADTTEPAPEGADDGEKAEGEAASDDAPVETPEDVPAEPAGGLG